MKLVKPPELLVKSLSCVFFIVQKQLWAAGEKIILPLPWPLYECNGLCPPKAPVVMGGAFSKVACVWHWNWFTAQCYLKSRALGARVWVPPALSSLDKRQGLETAAAVPCLLCSACYELVLLCIACLPATLLWSPLFMDWNVHKLWVK